MVGCEYYKLSNLQIQVEFEGKSPKSTAIATYFKKNRHILSAALNSSKYLINLIGEKCFPLGLQTTLASSHPIKIAQRKVKFVKIRYEADQITNFHNLPTVLAYASPNGVEILDAVVETDRILDIEIIKSPQKCSIHIDFSTFPLPRTDEMFAGIIHVTNVWGVEIDQISMIGNQEFPVTISTFGLVIGRAV